MSADCGREGECTLGTGSDLMPDLGKMPGLNWILDLS